MKNFSQNDEQETILKELSHIPNGNFLDIGAHDGESLSNTRALALSGWSGTLVEPNPNLFLRLIERYGHDPKITLINAAMSDKSGLTKFYYDKDGCQYSSSIAENIKKLFPANDYSISYLVNSIPPKDLNVENFDFVSIDAEGSDLAILRAFRGSLKKTQLICIEYSNADEIGTQKILEELFVQNFSEIKRTRENIIAKKTNK